MISLKANIELDIKFESYGNKKTDARVARHIEKWIKDVVEDELAYIPLYAEDGIEDSTRRIKAKVSVCG